MTLFMRKFIAELTAVYMKRAIETAFEMHDKKKLNQAK